jgi:predicted acetyltransferase|nr:hypothetical protein [Neobacillus niacini]
MVPWVVKKDPTNFEAMVQFLNDNEQGHNLPEGWVPDSTFWLINQDKRILGAVNIRHRLNEILIINNGGILDSDFIEEDGKIIKRFWIEI